MEFKIFFSRLLFTIHSPLILYFSRSMWCEVGPCQFIKYRNLLEAHLLECSLVEAVQGIALLSGNFVYRLH